MKYRKVNLAQFVVKYGHTLDHPSLVYLSLGVCLLFTLVSIGLVFFLENSSEMLKKVGGELWAAMRGFIAGPSSLQPMT